MKTLVLMFVAVMTACPVLAETEIERTPHGSGTPGQTGNEVATSTPDDGIYFAPQYMPGYPTAAVIWPRVVEVPCKHVSNNLVCENYKWKPEYGRGEYLLFTGAPIPEVKCKSCPTPTIVVLPPATPSKEIGE